MGDCEQDDFRVPVNRNIIKIMRGMVENGIVRNMGASPTKKSDQLKEFYRKQQLERLMNRDAKVLSPRPRTVATSYSFDVIPQKKTIAIHNKNYHEKGDDVRQKKMVQKESTTADEKIKSNKQKTDDIDMDHYANFIPTERLVFNVPNTPAPCAYNVPDPEQLAKDILVKDYNLQNAPQYKYVKKEPKQHEIKESPMDSFIQIKQKGKVDKKVMCYDKKLNVNAKQEDVMLCPATYSPNIHFGDRDYSCKDILIHRYPRNKAKQNIRVNDVFYNIPTTVKGQGTSLFNQDFQCGINQDKEFQQFLEQLKIIPDNDQ